MYEPKIHLMPQHRWAAMSTERLVRALLLAAEVDEQEPLFQWCTRRRPDVISLYTSMVLCEAEALADALSATLPPTPFLIQGKRGPDLPPFIVEHARKMAGKQISEMAEWIRRASGEQK